MVEEIIADTYKVDHEWKIAILGYPILLVL
jgi:hypothetical protein